MTCGYDIFTFDLQRFAVMKTINNGSATEIGGSLDPTVVNKINDFFTVPGAYNETLQSSSFSNPSSSAIDMTSFLRYCNLGTTSNGTISLNQKLNVFYDKKPVTVNVFGPKMVSGTQYWNVYPGIAEYNVNDLRKIVSISVKTPASTATNKLTYYLGA